MVVLSLPSGSADAVVHTEGGAANYIQLSPPHDPQSLNTACEES